MGLPYFKDPQDKNRLVVDEYAADVVRSIFRWKAEGVSPQDIADRLNAGGIYPDDMLEVRLRFTDELEALQAILDSAA